MRKYFPVVIGLFMWAGAAFVNLADEFVQVENSAEYQGASWENLVSVQRGLTIDQAYQYAKDHPEVTYFFHTVGWSLVLDTPRGRQRFNYGDAAFFSGKPWWGEAAGLANGYTKK